jgi:hypothetical protein
MIIAKYNITDDCYNCNKTQVIRYLIQIPGKPWHIMHWCSWCAISLSCANVNNHMYLIYEVMLARERLWKNNTYKNLTGFPAELMTLPSSTLEMIVCSLTNPNLIASCEREPTGL